MSDLLTALEKARAYFAKHGGAQGDYFVGDRCCVKGALQRAGGFRQWHYFDETGYAPLNALNLAAQELYRGVEVTTHKGRSIRVGTPGWSSIVMVNDLLSPQAVLDCFDLAIKKEKDSHDGH
jgi:hypothetical protein